jgi:hypothetical protein
MTTGESSKHGRKNLLPGGNDPFTCRFCGARVRPLRNGSTRNHCPECLWSLHVDRVPGDRAEQCGGPMKPLGLQGSSAEGWTITFRCLHCGALRRNRAAHDDPEQPDRWELLVELSTGILKTQGGEQP